MAGRGRAAPSKSLAAILLTVGCLSLVAMAAFSAWGRSGCAAALHKTAFDEFTASSRGDRVPPGLLSSMADLRTRPLHGTPALDGPQSERYLLTIPVGLKQKPIVQALVRGFDIATDDGRPLFQLILFHYDGQVDSWGDLIWRGDVIHVAASKQTKMWFAKRFLAVVVVSAYEFIFLWDEDIELPPSFSPLAYIDIARTHGLLISQPALGDGTWGSWPITQRREGSLVHHSGDPGANCQGNQACACPNGTSPGSPCGSYVEIMVPVIDTRVWPCVWSLIQPDLVHGWGLDLAWHACARDSARTMAIVDAQYVRHRRVPSLGDEGPVDTGAPAWQAVDNRRREEWRLFNERKAAPRG